MNKKNLSIFSRFLVSYIVILLVTISVGNLIYNKTLEVVRNDAIESSLSMLRQSRKIIDARFLEVENFVTQLALNPKINYFLNIKKPLHGPDYYKMQDVWKQLPDYPLTTDFIVDFIIYCKNSDIIISPSRVSLRTPLFYNGFLKYEGIDFPSWYEEMLDKNHQKDYLPASIVTSEGKQFSVITYIQSIPLDHFNRPKGVIVVLINENEIHKLLKPLCVKGGWVYVTDTRGNMVTSISPEEKLISSINIRFTKFEGFVEKTVGGEKVLIMYTTSSKNGWRYIAAIPSRVVLKKVEYVKRINLVMEGIMLFAGIWLACFLAYHNSKPIQGLVRKLRQQLDKGEDTVSEYEFLDKSISELIENNRSLQEALANQIPLLKAAFFERLLRGEFNNEREIDSFLSNVNMEIRGSCFNVLLLRMEGYKSTASKELLRELSVKKLIIKEILKKIMKERGYIHDFGENRIAILVTFPFYDEEKCVEYVEAVVKKIQEEVRKVCNIQVSFAAGNLYRNLLDVSRSFVEAVKALHLVDRRRKKPVLWYSDISKGNSGGYYYPMEVENRLINLVKAGEYEEVEKLLKSLYRENFIKRRLSAEITKLLMYDISGTIMKIMDEIEMKVPERIGELKEILEELDNNSIDECYSSVMERYLYLSRIFDSRKKSHNIQLKDRIIEYIHANYMDANLSLTKVAEHFNVSETYLSQFFKEQTGENFSNYIEKIRMEHARKLLINNENLSINIIAKKVGYNNTNTFYKAFRRLEGISPKAYRQVTKLQIRRS